MNAAVPPGSGDPWYRRAFGRFYPLIYPHRGAGEALRSVESLLPLLPAGTVLDMACGAGRHLLALDRMGRRAIGLDLSPDLLQLARRSAPHVPVVRGDMRCLPFGEGTFAAVLSMFSSFGYFEPEEDDLRVLAGVGRVLVPGGVLVLDLPGPSRARESDGVVTERSVEGYGIREERRLARGGRRVEKKITLSGLPGGGLLDEYTETVRLYEPGELEALLGRIPLVPISFWGDYSGGAYGPRSERLIVIARRAPRPGPGGEI